MKRPLTISLSLCFAIFSFLVQAQNEPVHRCATDELHEEKMNDPAFAEKFNKLESFIRDQVDFDQRIPCGSPIIVPVAVHFSGAVNASNVNCLIDKCNEQIQVMNEDFGGYNLDITNYCDISDACSTDYPPTAVGGGTCIQFCLGSSNLPACEPAGNLIGGLAITVGQYTWPNTGPCWAGYMNIFVYDLPGGLLGQAPLFGGANPNGNGFRVTASAFGGAGSGCVSGTGIDTNGTYGLGRTSTHEAGHYFGLPHTFAGCGNGDGIDDTPSQNSSNFGCPSVNLSTCTSSAGNSCGAPDFFFNFMDYVNDACMYMFTEDQGQLMFNTASSGGWSNSCFPSVGYSPLFPTGCFSSTPLALDLVDAQDLLCFGDFSGLIEVSATGGSAPYTFTINGTSNGNDPLFLGLTGGSYVIEVFDANFNSERLMVMLNEPMPLSVFAQDINHVSCGGYADGSYNLLVSGGTPGLSDYNVNINGGSFGNQTSFTNLSGNFYFITVSDANGCEFDLEVEIVEPPQLELGLDSTDANTCFGDSLAIMDFNANGGFPDYTFTIYDTVSNSNGLFENIGGDSLIILLTDLNNCEFLDTFAIPGPDTFALEANMLMDNLCFGDSLGMASLGASGGNGDNTYEINGTWTNDTGIFDNLPSGIDLYASVVDSNNCVAYDTFQLTQPDEILVDITDITPVTCGGNNDGAIMANASGGSGALMYSIDGSNFQVSGEFQNLNGGNYTIYVQDEATCVQMQEAVVPEDSPLSTNLVSLTDAECLGDFSGTISVEATGGSGTIEYTLDGSTSNNTGVFDNLTTGTYSIVALDENMCSDTYDFEIGGSSDLSFAIQQQEDILCFNENNGIINVEGMNGNGGFTYSLDGVNFVNSGLFENLSADDYEVIIMDNTGCSYSEMISISEPNEITIDSWMIENLDCFESQNGTAQILAFGGTGALTYDFYTLFMSSTDGNFTGLPAGIHPVLVTDENDCQVETLIELSQPDEITYMVTDQVDSNCDMDPIGSFVILPAGGAGNFSFTLGTMMNTTGIFDNLPAGNYEVLIQDGSNCETTAFVDISSGSSITAEMPITQSPSCIGDMDGSVQINADGGTGTLSYELNGVSNTTGIFNGLGQGNFVISITDEMDCLTTQSFSLSDPEIIITNVISTTAATCDGGNNGIVEIEATGGAGGFTFAVNGESNTTGTFNTLPTGSYVADITDANGCESTASFSIEGPDPINGFVNNQTDVSCFGENDGTVSFGSDLDVVVELDGIPLSPDDLNSLGAGDYEFTLITADDCFENLMVTIGGPEAILLDLSNQIDNPCAGFSEGSVSVSASGGNGNFTYSMNGNSNTTGIFNDLPAGAYNIIVQDDNLCEESISANIQDGIELSANVVNTAVDTGTGNGLIELNVSGGQSPYSYSLGGGPDTDSPLFSQLSGGIYDVIITDQNGCQLLFNFEIELMERPDNSDLLNFVCKPNPTSDQFTIEFESNGDQDIEYFLFDGRGQIVLRDSQVAISGANSKTFELRHLETGVYMLEMQGERISRSKKIVKITN